MTHPTDPLVLSVEFNESAVTINWLRPAEQTNLGSQYYSTVLTREGIESDQDLTYWYGELQEDAQQLIMAVLKAKNRS